MSREYLLDVYKAELNSCVGRGALSALLIDSWIDAVPNAGYVTIRPNKVHVAVVSAIELALVGIVSIGPDVRASYNTAAGIFTSRRYS